MKHLLLILAVLLALPSAASATAQRPDFLIIEGQESPLTTNPLDALMSQRPAVFLALMKHAQPYMGCSALWRGYIATWEIRDNELYLNKVVVNGCSQTPIEVPLSDLFSGMRGPVKADWVSGNLTVPQGKVVHYVHMGYQTEYEGLHVYAVDKGVITGVRKLRHKDAPPQ